jgi:hypothetical protein
MCQRVSYKKKIGEKIILYALLKSLEKGVESGFGSGAGSGSNNQGYGSGDPDPHQNVTDEFHEVLP